MSKHGGEMQCWRRHVSQKAAHKAERDAKAAGKGSFAWAWLLDERAEELRRSLRRPPAWSACWTRPATRTLCPT